MVKAILLSGSDPVELEIGPDPYSQLPGPAGSLQRPYVLISVEDDVATYVESRVEVDFNSAPGDAERMLIVAAVEREFNPDGRMQGSARFEFLRSGVGWRVHITRSSVPQAEERVVRALKREGVLVAA